MLYVRRRKTRVGASDYTPELTEVKFRRKVAGSVAITQCHAEVVVAGVVVAEALFWTDIVTVFGLFVTDFAQSDYDHFSYDHLCVVPNNIKSGSQVQTIL